MSELYDLSISRNPASVTRASFTNALVLGASARFSDAYRVYDLTGAVPLAGMLLDGFVATDPEYLAVARLCSSSVRPTKVVVANATSRPTLRYRVVPVTVANNTTYKLTLTVAGVSQTASYTSDSTATGAEVVAGLKAAVDGLSLAGVVTTTGTTWVDVAASTAGVFFSLVVGDRTLLTQEMVHADPGVAADLSALALAVQASNGAADFYVVLLCFPSTATVLAAAAWTEANQRLLLFSTADTRSVRAYDSSSPDICTQLYNAAYARTACLWHHDPGSFAAAGWAGRCLPLTPGTETWLAKTIGGLTISSLTGSERAQLQARRTTYYVADHGLNLTVGEPGAQTFSGEYLDNRRGIDALSAATGEDYVAAFGDVDVKFPYDDTGFQQLAGIIEHTWRGYESDSGQPRLLLKDSVVLSVPRLSQVSDADRAARRVPITISASLANAAHKAVITGRLQ